MALTITPAWDNGGTSVFGNQPVALATLTWATGDNYASGGFALTAQQFGLGGTITALIQTGANTTSVTYELNYNTQTGNAQIISGGSEYSGSLASLSFTVLLFTTAQ